MNGKGSNPRPLSVSKREFDHRWEQTFRRENSLKKLVEWCGWLDSCVASKKDSIVTSPVYDR
jgi:hypothetical protein